MNNQPNDPEQFSASFRTPYQILREYLDEKEINYAAHDTSQHVTLSVLGECCVKECCLRITHGETLLQIQVNYPLFVKSEKMKPLVAELFTRANYGMTLGKFELDMNDGETRFQAAQLIGAQALDKDVISNLFITCLQTADRYFGSLMSVLYAGVTPGDAVYIAELDMHSQRLEAPSKAETASPQEKVRRLRRGPKKGNRLQIADELQPKPHSPEKEGSQSPEQQTKEDTLGSQDSSDQENKLG